jgi:hypothetical protein
MTAADAALLAAIGFAATFVCAQPPAYRFDTLAGP